MQNNLEPKKKLITIKETILVLFGTFLFAVAIKIFTAPNQLAPGGVSGLSTIINYVSFDVIPIGIINAIINVPIAIVGLIFLGKSYMLKTLISLVSFTVFTDFVLNYVPVYTENELVAAIFGGVLMGVGIGIVMLTGGSSGGMDIINKLIHRRLPHMRLGQVTFATDLAVVALSAFAYKSIEPALYALISLYISAAAMDKVLYGFNTCRLMYIISSKTEEIQNRINVELNRGATILEARGSYTNEPRPTILVAVRQTEYYRMRKIVKEEDRNAFIMVTAANEIMGEGFDSNGI